MQFLYNTDIGVMLYELLRTFNLLVGWATTAGPCDVDKLQVLAVIGHQKLAGHFRLQQSQYKCRHQSCVFFRNILTTTRVFCDVRFV
jgi:hypothetical protein